MTTTREPHVILGTHGLETVTVREQWDCPCGVQVTAIEGEKPLANYGPWCVHCRTQRGGPWPIGTATPCRCRKCRTL